MAVPLHDNFVPFLLGGLVILFFSYRRFNTPLSSRSSTTAFRYHTAALTYAFLALALWLLVTLVGLDLIPLTGKGDVPDHDPILGALLITGLLPHTPGLDRLDLWLRTKLHSLAAIPHEMGRLTDLLKDAEMSLPGDLRAETRARMLAQGFREEDVVFEANGSLEQQWTSLTALLVRLRSWRAEPRRGPFLVYLEEWREMKEGYDVLLPKARVFFDSMRDVSEDPQDERSEVVKREYRALFQEHILGLYELGCKVVSRVVLGCHATHSARRQELRSAGFEIEARTVFSLDQVVAVFLLVFFLMAPVMAFNQAQASDNIDLREALAISLMISCIYSAAVVCSIYPRDRWQRWAQRRPGAVRPWRFYLVAGLMAAGIGSILSFFTRCSLFRDLGTAWEETVEKSPWLLMAFAAAFIIAFLSDDEPADSDSDIFWRLLEGGVAAGVLMVAATMVLGLLELSTGGGPPVVRLMLMSGAIGFFLGAFVPHWYRHPEDKKEAEKKDQVSPARPGLVTG